MAAVPWEQIVPILVALAGVAVAWLKSRGQARTAAILETVIRGVESGAPGGSFVKREIARVATGDGVQERLDAIVQRVVAGRAPPGSPPPRRGS